MTTAPKDTIEKDDLWQQMCCVKCGEPLRDPITFSCNHSVCNVCLKQLWNEQSTGDGIVCPAEDCTLCISANTVEEFVPNAALADAVPVFTKEIVKHKAENKKKVTCKVHHKRVHGYCEEHEQLICAECLMKDHGKCNKEGIKAKVQIWLTESCQTRGEVDKALEVAKNRLADLRKTKDELCKTSQQKEDALKDIAAQIERDGSVELKKNIQKDLTNLYIEEQKEKCSIAD